jgi:stage V sporulation protein G
MTITEVRVYPVDQEKLRAYVSIVLDHCFLVSDIKVISGTSGLFVSMPSKRKKTGEFKDIAHPLNSETRRWMADQILAEYHRALQAKAASPAVIEEPRPSDGEPDHTPEEEKVS